MKVYRDKYDRLICDSDLLKFDNSKVFIFKMIGERAVLLSKERFVLLNADRICYDNKFYSAIIETIENN